MSMSAALSGLRAARAEIEATSNNIANVSAVGFKRQNVEFNALLEGTTKDGVRSDFDQGSLKETGKPLDIAITGTGFFTIKNSLDAGAQFFTRAGSFELNNENYLVNNAGQFVMGFAGVDGAIPDPLGELTGLQLLDATANPDLTIDSVQVDTNGKIKALYNDGSESLIGQLALSTFKETSRLENIGGAQFIKTAKSGEPITGIPGSNATGSLLAGSLEGSNVDISVELIELIEAQRNYQAAAKAIETTSEISETVRNIRV
jgi:flagellar hook protein FlgE